MSNFLAMMDIWGNFLALMVLRVSTYIRYRFLIKCGVSIHNLLNYLIDSNFVIRLMVEILRVKHPSSAKHSCSSARVF